MTSTTAHAGTTNTAPLPNHMPRAAAIHHSDVVDVVLRPGNEQCELSSDPAASAGSSSAQKVSPEYCLSSRTKKTSHSPSAHIATRIAAPNGVIHRRPIHAA